MSRIDRRPHRYTRVLRSINGLLPVIIPPGAQTLVPWAPGPASSNPFVLFEDPANLSDAVDLWKINKPVWATRLRFSALLTFNDIGTDKIGSISILRASAAGGVGGYYEKQAFNADPGDFSSPTYNTGWLPIGAAAAATGLMVLHNATAGGVPVSLMTVVGAGGATADLNWMCIEFADNASAI